MVVFLSKERGSHHSRHPPLGYTVLPELSNWDHEGRNHREPILNLMISTLSMRATALSYLSPRNTTAAAIQLGASSPPRSC